MKDTIVILGAGGHARVLIELIKLVNVYEIYGIVDPLLDKGSRVEGIRILGGDEVLQEIINRGINNVCIGVGSVKDTRTRKGLYEKCKSMGFNIPYLIHPTAYVSKTAKISEGCQIMAGVIIQTKTFIGNNVVVNTGAIIEHDCHIENHVFIAPGAVISGGVKIGEGSFIGSGAIIIQGIKIGKNAVVAAGAVVVRDVPDGTVVKGVPTK